MNVVPLVLILVKRRKMVSVFLNPVDTFVCTFFDECSNVLFTNYEPFSLSKAMLVC